MSVSNNATESSSRSVEEKVVLLCLYVPSIFLCVVGNILAIIVFVRGHRSRSDIRNFFVCLSVADLLVGLFCQPFTFVFIFTRAWMLPAWLCPVALFFQLLSVTVSVATNMVIGLDRLWMILVPLKSRITKSRSTLVIAVIWFVSGLLSSVQLAVARAKEQNGTVICSEEWPGEVMSKIYTVTVAILTYVLPLSVLAVTYAIVGIKVWHRKPPGVIDSRQAVKHLMDKKKTIKMLVVIVFLFGLCWLPIHFFFFVIDFGIFRFPLKFEMWFYILAHWLAMANSFVNPIIYGFMNKSFRDDLAYLFRRCFLIDTGTSDQRTYSYSTARRSRAQFYKSMYPGRCDTEVAL